MSGLSLEHQTFTITKEDNIRNISSEVRSEDNEAPFQIVPQID